MTDARRDRWLLAALVAGLSVIAYLPSLSNGFALDDVVGIVDDQRIRDPARALDLLTEPYLTHVPVERSPYRPLTTLSYVLSWAQGAGDPFPFHALNVAAHAAVSVVLLSLLLALGAVPVAAAAGAALFAVHPVHVEAVAGVVGRADVLATLLCLVALRAHVSRLPAPVRVGAVSLAYFAALGFKEGAVVLPGILYVIDLARSRGGLGGAVPARAGASADRIGIVGTLMRPLRDGWRTYGALAAALAAFLAVRSAVLGGVVHLDVASYIVILPTWLRVTTAVANLSDIARLLLLPVDLSPEYGPAVILPAGPGSLRFWAGAAVAVSVILIAATGARRGGGGHWLAAGIAWLVVAFALVSNLVLPLPMWIAERTLYLPSAGLALAVVGLLHAAGVRGPALAAPSGSPTEGTDPAPPPEPARHPLARGSARGALAAVAVACVLGAAHSWTRSGVWRSDEALFADLVERHPESFRAQWWLGGRMIDAGDVAGGTVWLERAVESNPNSVLLTLDLARALLLDGRIAEAEALVLPISPALHPSRSVYLAQSHIFAGREADAVEAVREGLRYFPDDPRLLEQAGQLGIEP